MTVISFARQRTGRTGTDSTKFDLWVSHSIETKNPSKVGLVLRLSGKAMQSIGWKTGDRIEASYDDGSEMWTLTRKANGDGISLSTCGRSDGSGTARFSSTLHELAKVGVSRELGGYGCTTDLVRCDVAFFVRGE